MTLCTLLPNIVPLSFSWTQLMLAQCFEDVNTAQVLLLFILFTSKHYYGNYPSRIITVLCITSIPTRDIVVSIL